MSLQQNLIYTHRQQTFMIGWTFVSLPNDLVIGNAKTILSGQNRGWGRMKVTVKISEAQNGKPLSGLTPNKTPTCFHSKQ